MSSTIVIPPLIENLSAQMKLGLPGIAAHKKMMPSGRDMSLAKQDAVLSAVMIVLFQDLETMWNCIIIQRPVYDGIHSGQAALPGGKFETFDENTMGTALRETKEEICIDPEKLNIFGQLSPLYIPPSNFLVHPYLAYHQGIPQLIPNLTEVHSIHYLPLKHLLSPRTINFEWFPAGDGKIKAPCYLYERLKIWGATAMILSELKELLLMLPESF
ncbi:MAG: CoA pyrophosphatase [Bacteroidales bacterium]|jgi:8-oxo-dGTP pyrophosphatase MutT (NUDIX family)|nr:CoA pyrophosphatase [Bacteroidales bacterium]